MVDGKIEVDLEVNSDRAAESVKSGAGRVGGLFQEAMVGGARFIGEAFVSMSAKALQAVGDIAQAGVDFNAKMQTYQTAFTTLLGDAEKAEAVMAQIRDDAARTPFDVDSLTQANRALIAAGVDSKAAQKDVLNLANAIAAVGGGSAELSRMAANMQQIKNTGKATAMDIRQFANAGINIYAVLADYMGVTAEEAAKLDVTYDQLSAAMEKAAATGGMYAGALEAQSKTFDGQISTLKDNLTQLSGTLTQELFAALAENVLPQVTEWVQVLLSAAQENGIAGALEAAGNILRSLVEKFLKGLPKMLDTGLTLLENLLRGIIRGIPKAIPVILQVVSGLIAGFLDHLPELLGLGVELLVAVIMGLLEAVPWMLTQIPLIIDQIFLAFKNADWASIGRNIMEGLWEGIKALAGWLTDGITGLVNGIFGIATDDAIDEVDGKLAARSSSTVGSRSSSGTPFAASGGSFGGSRAAAAEDRVSFNRTARGGAQITVPVDIDGREVARATAFVTSEQMAWEEMA